MLYLNNNQLSGEIPVELVTLTSLWNLSIGNNALSGIIPAGLCDLTNLQYVNFMNNNFDDQICPTIKCLVSKGVNFEWDSNQTQQSGFSLITDCVSTLLTALSFDEVAFLLPDAPDVTVAVADRFCPSAICSRICFNKVSVDF